MLFTRCPDCDTTFRITADALRKADGQVRCGRCASVFNAYTELRRGTNEAYGDDGVVRTPPAPHIAEPTAAPIADEGVTGMHGGGEPSSAAPHPGTSPAPRTAASPASSETADAAAVAPRHEAEKAAVHRSAAAATRARAAGPPSRAKARQADEPAFEGVTLANVIDELEASADDEESPADAATPDLGETDAATPDLGETDAAPNADTLSEAASTAKSAAGAAPSPPVGGVPNGVLHAARSVSLAASSASVSAMPDAAAEAEADAASDDDRAPTGAPSWVILEGEEPRRASRTWIFGCLAAAALLALQITHHYRAPLAATAIVGPWLREAYAFVGSELSPAWRLEQYEIIDWTAIAEPNASGQGSLKIAARIYNRGPREQPFPHIHVQLKDRWENTVESRVFAPSEYLSSSAAAKATMHAGRTADAELDIVDPGPDAYGFELDVCIPANGDGLRCAADAVFR